MKKLSKKKKIVIGISSVIVLFIVIPMTITIAIYEMNFGQRSETEYIKYEMNSFENLERTEIKFKSNNGQVLAGHIYLCH